MTSHKVATRAEWRKARLDLLKAEKALTRQGDAVAAQRQALPWVPVETIYRFETEQGIATLKDLFQGRSQLMVYHFMFGPDFKAGCTSCSAIADGFNGITTHLSNHDVSLYAVSRAPLPKLQAYKRRMGWSFPWASCSDSNFACDFSVSFTEEQQRNGDIHYNYQNRGHAMDIVPAPQPVAELAGRSGVDAVTYGRDRPGMSTFVIKDNVVYHAYSTYSRGVESLWNMYQWLDHAPLGRNESGVWFRRHDEYDKAS